MQRTSFSAIYQEIGLSYVEMERLEAQQQQQQQQLGSELTWPPFGGGGGGGLRGLLGVQCGKSDLCTRGAGHNGLCNRRKLDSVLSVGADAAALRATLRAALRWGGCGRQEGLMPRHVRQTCALAQTPSPTLAP